jgi:hypothetical protein
MIMKRRVARFGDRDRGAPVAAVIVIAVIVIALRRSGSA